MSNDDPFAEANDTEKTVIRPNPGGRLTGGYPAPQQPAAPPPQQPQQPYGDPTAQPPAPGPALDSFGIPAPAPAAQPAAAQAAPGAAPRPQGGEPPEIVITGMNRINACAAPLFSLISRIRNRAQHMDPDKLRQSVVGEVRGFESRALQAGVEAQTVKIARYALCATLDDVVLNTPWGSQSSWGMQSMVGTFHRETVGGDRFYDLLARLEKEPANNIDLLEFIYMCLSLGFEGRLRVEQGGADRHMQIRLGLARIIRAQRGAMERDLSPHWEGVDRPHRKLSAWKPVWIALAVTGLLLMGQFGGLSYLLSTRTENLIGQLSVIDTGPAAELERRAPPPPPPPPTVPRPQLEKVSSFLQEEISDEVVNVFEAGNTITIRIAGSGMFGSGSDTLDDSFRTRMERVARSLNQEPGRIIIVGHSDNIPIRSSRFPSNMHLSLARAKSVMAEIAETLDDPSRMSAEGRADSEPIADNATAAGRAKNRRIEVLLVQEQ